MKQWGGWTAAAGPSNPTLLADARRLARRERLTVEEWVRRALREARSSRPGIEPEAKLKRIVAP